MAPKSFYQLFSCILLLLVMAFPDFSDGEGDIPKGQSTSPFEFLKNLEGCCKGENVTGLHKLKNYLKQFGYLDYHLSKDDESHDNDDVFDDLLESAIKTYQSNYHLNATGILDAQTVGKMMTSRCGVPDIINGTNWMAAQHHHNGSSLIHGVYSHYTFYKGKKRWPASKTHLTYAFSSNVPGSAIDPIDRAFRVWASETRFTFSWKDYSGADIRIGFYQGAHGDGHPFDGPGGVIAHATAPTSGMIHYDADEQFSIGPHPDGLDIETVALHEIGHVLGLGHTTYEDAVMWPTIPKGKQKIVLHWDDILGIKTLYGN